MFRKFINLSYVTFFALPYSCMVMNGGVSKTTLLILIVQGQYETVQATAATANFLTLNVDRDVEQDVRLQN